MTTDRRELRYDVPAQGEVPQAVRELWNTRDTMPLVTADADRPASPYDGQHHYRTDTGDIEIWTGSTWGTVGPGAVGPHALTSHTDVTITTPSGGHYLRYNGSLWVNAAIVKADITDFAHTHVKADITDFAHTHVKADITDFAHTHVKADITDWAVAASELTAGDFPAITSTSYRMQIADASTATPFIIKRTGVGAAAYAYLFQIQNNGGTSIMSVDPDGAVFAASYEGSGASLTGIPLSTGTTGTLAATRGGTAQAAWTKGDILYASALNTLARLPLGGTPGWVLKVGAAGIPEWAAVGATGAVLLEPGASEQVILGTALSANLVMRGPDGAATTPADSTGIVWRPNYGGVDDYEWEAFADATAQFLSTWTLTHNSVTKFSVSSAGLVTLTTASAHTVAGQLTSQSIVPSTGATYVLGTSGTPFLEAWFQHRVRIAGNSNPHVGLNNGSFDSYLEVATGRLRLYRDGVEHWGVNTDGSVDYNVATTKAHSFRVAATEEAYIDAAGLNLSAGNVFKVGGTQVVSSRGAAVTNLTGNLLTDVTGTPDATYSANEQTMLSDLQTAVNDLNTVVENHETVIGDIVARLEAHGLIAV